MGHYTNQNKRNYNKKRSSRSAILYSEITQQDLDQQLNELQKEREERDAGDKKNRTCKYNPQASSKFKRSMPTIAQIASKSITPKQNPGSLVPDYDHIDSNTEDSSSLQPKSLATKKKRPTYNPIPSKKRFVTARAFHISDEESATKLSYTDRQRKPTTKQRPIKKIDSKHFVTREK